MLIAHFNEVKFRVPNPLRPGTSSIARRFEKGTGVTTMSHEGQTFESDEYGWFDVPEHVGQFWLRRPGWKTPHEVEADIVAGFISSENDAPTSAARAASRSRSKKAAAE